MNKYPKIKTVFERDPLTKFKTLLHGEYALEEFEYLKDNLWIFAEKVDGTNIRIKYQEGQISFCGRTDRASIPKPLQEKLNKIFYHPSILGKMFDKDVCLYGEGYGAKIQKGGGNYRADQSFVLFDVKIEGHWLQRKNVECVASGLGLDVVPLVGTGTLHEMAATVKEGFKSQWGDFLAEGIVARPVTELLGRNGERIITKIKHKDFSHD